MQRETITYATVTIQNYFRMYGKLAGMTGTALTEAEEFFKVYGLEVVAVPDQRCPWSGRTTRTSSTRPMTGKFRAVVDQIAELNAEGRPVLVGTTSIERSEQLSALLRRRGIKHEVLNAKNHAREAQIVAEAGKPGAVTVSTNMAGRGTDIILGGDPSSETEPGAWQKCTRGRRRERRPLRDRHRAARVATYRQPAARTLRTPGGPRRDALLRLAGRRDTSPASPAAWWAASSARRSWKTLRWRAACSPRAWR